MQGLELLRDLLTVEVPLTLNAALCEFHRGHCPPSPQLELECSRVHSRQPAAFDLGCGPRLTCCIDWLPDMPRMIMMPVIATQVSEDMQKLEQAHRRLGAIVPCSNSDLRCDRWAAAGECHNNDMWMHQHCRRACTPCAFSVA